LFTWYEDLFGHVIRSPPSGVATVYGTRGEFSRLALPPPSLPVKTGGQPPVRKNIFNGLAANRQEYSFAKIDLYIFFLTNVKEMMGAGLGGAKWAQISACANDKLLAPGWGAPNGLKLKRAQTINYGRWVGGTKLVKINARTQTIIYGRRARGRHQMGSNTCTRKL